MSKYYGWEIIYGDVTFADDVVIEGSFTEELAGTFLGALTLGDATHTGGDLTVKRNATNNNQLSVDADAAQSATALTLYGKAQAYGFVAEAGGFAAGTALLTASGDVFSLASGDSFGATTFSGDVTHSTTVKSLFRDAAISISSINDGYLDFAADTGFRWNAIMTLDGSGLLSLPTGASAGVYFGAVQVYEISANLLGFGANDEVRVAVDNKLYFRDAAISIASIDDGHLDLTADVSIDLNGAVALTRLSSTKPAAAYSTVASDNLKNSNDAEKSTVATGYTKIKETKLGEVIPGARVKFDLKTAGGGATATARVYKNTVAIGTEQTDVTGGYVTKSEDLTGFAAGDLIQIYAKTSDGAQAAYVQNFRLYYDFALDTTALSVTNQDP